MDSTPNFHLHLNQWVIEIFKSEDIDFPICVFKVPNSLRAAKPEAYLPQVVGLGLLHHKRLELESMQMYKLGVAKNIHKGFGGIELKILILGLLKLVPSVRACYQMYFEANDIEIACTMAIDGLFLLELLCYYGIGKDTLTKSDILCRLVDTAGTRLAQDGILRDTMMLENQIPIIALKNILLAECSNSASKEEKSLIVKKYLPQMMCSYCKALSPLNVLEKYPASIALKRAHLLDLLYHLIMLKEPPEEEAPEEEAEEDSMMQKKSLSDIPPVLLSILKALDVPQEVKKPIELAKGLLDLPWSNLDPNSIKNIVPAEKEVLIPTASRLCDVGVKFFPDHITAIGFDLDKTSFKLPLIKLDVNSEVIIRNLVAYEAMSKSESEPLVFTRYFQLMNGIIETEKDVKVLRDHGILQSESMKDDEVVKIFSGTTTQPIREANAHDLDKAIAAVNNYYNGLRKVKACKFIKKCVLTLWNVRTIFAAILLLSLMALQTFCSVYGCSHIFNKTN
ncbi:putative UPF0481 protein At3g02645 [Quercus lobata]|uniref:Uncharacterized protein n=1 Tax=Quercus lobata TaxID=97700 RepID=A0A7N2RD29_QUELO|nr:putative UPF0481 protein At3g02645 [Quercus lobata]XP_030944838.1 putative UPF0481 protein At3g02645 [Quercus lobata]